ncbi:MAG: hypothetical protein AAB400_02445 [Patescibacteria group bacterium]
MILTKKQLFSLTVITTRGIALGRVIDIELDSVSQSIVTYQARPYWKWRKTLQAGILPASFRIQRSHVVRITENELIVEDAAIPVEVRQNAVVSPSKRQVPQEAPARAPIV